MGVLGRLEPAINRLVYLSYMGHVFYVWATLVSGAGVDSFVAKLVRRGFNVEPLAESDAMTLEGDYATLAALKIVHDKVPAKTGNEPTEPQAWCHKIIKEVLTEVKVSWHSLVVLNVGGTCTWSGAHYFIETPPKSPPKSTETQIDRIDKEIGDGS
jgi:hypothetical protein